MSKVSSDGSTVVKDVQRIKPDQDGIPIIGVQCHSVPSISQQVRSHKNEREVINFLHVYVSVD